MGGREGIVFKANNIFVLEDNTEKVKALNAAVWEHEKQYYSWKLVLLELHRASIHCHETIVVKYQNAAASAAHNSQVIEDERIVLSII